MRTLTIALFTTMTLAACGPAPGSARVVSDEASAETTATPGASSAATYVDVEETLAEMSDDTMYEAWRQIYDTLHGNFDDVCGDTFCGGDYSNLEPLRLRCSMDSKKQTLKSCAYVFAGSYETITASTGTIKVNAKTFSCHLPVSGIALADFMSTLLATGTTPALRRTLPGGTTSIYDNLVGCI